MGSGLRLTLIILRFKGKSMLCYLSSKRPWYWYCKYGNIKGVVPKLTIVSNFKTNGIREFARLLKEEYDDTIAAKIHHHKSHDSRNHQD